MKKYELSKDNEKEYELPDGQIIKIGNELFRCSEILFEPVYIGKQCKGISELIYDSIMNIDDEDIDLIQLMCDNIVLSGGNTMFNGLDKRLENELKQKYKLNTKIIAPVNRKYSAWIGGSILSSLTTFQQRWITKQQYDEYGPLSVIMHCF